MRSQLRSTTHVDKLMTKMGFDVTVQGPYVAELHKTLEKKIANGLISMSGGTWFGPLPSDEERARAMLAMQWEVDHGHSCRIDSLDRPIVWSTNVATMRRRLRVRWSRILPWLGDQWRLALMDIRVFWDRKILKRVNPYKEMAR